jgi:hypothetical protein
MNLRKLYLTLAAVATIGVVACGGGGEEAAAPAPAETSAPASSTPDLSNAGTISGRVAFEGEVPEASPIAMDADPYCLATHTEPVVVESVVVNDGNLENVFVFVREGAEQYTFPAAADAVVLNQVGCMYSPHVIGLQTGQNLVIRNDDDTLHNVNVQPANNPPFNIGQPVRGMETERSFPNPEIGIPVRCDVHPWMAGFISVFDNPYFNTTGDDGAFSLDQLPPGDYVVEAWHETLGTQMQSVTVAPNETADVSFTFGG